MGSTIWDFGVTTPYGYVPGYPLNNSFHRGIDYGAPLNTPVTVNDFTIGLSGNTGASTGPHTHVGKWKGAQVQDPGYLGGKTLTGAKVVSTGYDKVNGNNIRLEAEGFQWVYLHLNKINVKVGDIIGEPMSTIDLNLARQQADAQWGWGTVTQERTDILNRDIVGKETNEAINFMFNHPWGVEWRTYIDKLEAEVADAEYVETKVYIKKEK